MDYERKKNFWLYFSGATAVFTIIMFIIMVNQEDASSGAKVSAILMLIGIIVFFVGVVKINIYIAKSKNMSADEYISDRFANAIPETKEVFGIKDKDDSNITVKCPYCQSTNTRKISSVSKAGSIAVWGVYAAGKVSKQWHCNNCKSDF